MNRFIFSLPSLYRLDTPRIVSIRPVLQKLHVDSESPPVGRTRPAATIRELSRTPHSLTCAVDDQRQTDHRSESYSGAGGEAWSDARRIRADQKDSRPRAEFYRARNLFGDVERALLLQEFTARAEEISDERA